MSNEKEKIISIQICDSTYWAIVIAAISLTIVLFTATLSHYYSKRLQSAFENGYEEGVLPGSSVSQWVKTK